MRPTPYCAPVTFKPTPPLSAASLNFSTAAVAKSACCPTDLGLSNYQAVCPKEFPFNTCGSACAPVFLFFWSECGDWARTNLTTTDPDIAGEMQTTADICQGTMLRDGARMIYEAVSGSKTVYLSVGAYVMIMPPFVFLLLFVFFGRHLATLFRMLICGGAFALVILWPTLSQFFGVCGLGAEMGGLSKACNVDETQAVTAGTLANIAFSCVVAACASFTSRQKKRVGNGIQGFVLGYIIAMWTTNLWIGGMTQNVDTTWLVFGIQLLFGAGGSVSPKSLPPRSASCCRGVNLGFGVGCSS